MNKKDKIKAIVLFICVMTTTIIIIQLVSLGMDYLRKLTGLESSNITNNKSETSISSNNVNEPTIFDQYKDYKRVSIYPNGIETPSNYTESPTTASTSLANAGVRIKINGDILDAFIYIKAGANNESGSFTQINKKYDGIWFYLENGSFDGGILNLSKSIFGQPSQFTELLFDLKNVPLAKDNTDYRKNIYENKDLLFNLKDSRIVGALVSTNRYGKIIELTIGYKCNDEKNECSIVLQ